MNSFGEGIRRLLVILTWSPPVLYTAFIIYCMIMTIVEFGLSEFISVNWLKEIFGWQLWACFIPPPFIHVLINYIFQVGEHK